MSTIEEIVTKHYDPEVTLDSAGLKALCDDLIEREQEIADRLKITANKFGLLPAVVSKVAMEIGLGAPPTEEEREYIDTAYAQIIEQSRIHHERQVALAIALGREIPEEFRTFRDPLEVEDMVIPDTPPEA